MATTVIARAAALMALLVFGEAPNQRTTLAPDPGATAVLRAEPRWEHVAAAGRGEWPESWRAGRFPLAVKPVIGHDSALWMLHARGVWRSADGMVWERRAESVPWGERSGTAVVAFRGALWALGGSSNGVRSGEIWRSTNGTSWTSVAVRAGWSPRDGHAAVVYRDALWVLGGNDGADRSDVWRSVDGERWEQVTADAGWTRSGHAAAAWRDRLWVVGGSTWQTGRTDTWSSGNGMAWQRESSAAPWSARMYSGMVAAGDRLWMFGGSELAQSDGWKRDVWWTDDGRKWHGTASDAPWTARTGQYSVLFRGQIWMFGGKGFEPDGGTGFADDVWKMTP